MLGFVLFRIASGIGGIAIVLAGRWSIGWACWTENDVGGCEEMVLFMDVFCKCACGGGDDGMCRGGFLGRGGCCYDISQDIS